MFASCPLEVDFMEPAADLGWEQARKAASVPVTGLNCIFFLCGSVAQSDID